MVGEGRALSVDWGRSLVISGRSSCRWSSLGDRGQN